MQESQNSGAGRPPNDRKNICDLERCASGSEGESFGENGVGALEEVLTALQEASLDEGALLTHVRERGVAKDLVAGPLDAFNTGVRALVASLADSLSATRSLVAQILAQVHTAGMVSWNVGYHGAALFRALADTVTLNGSCSEETASAHTCSDITSWLVDYIPRWL